MKILLIGLLDEATGNATTLQRIGKHLEGGGHQIVFLHSKNIHDRGSLLRFCTQEQCAAALGIHAFGAGQYLRHLTVPTIIVFGGTDLNEDIQNPERLSVMTDAVIKATFLVTFNHDFTKRVQNFWPLCAHKTHCIPQGVHTHPSGFSLRKKLHLSIEDILFLLPAGIRKVKDPLYLAEMMVQWHREDPHIHLVIVGSNRDPIFAEKVRRKIEELSGITLLPPLPTEDLHAAMKEADAVLNTSHSECSPNGILEAMALGTPVIARAIPGNTSIVKNNITGLIFSSPEEFQQCATRLLNDTRLQRTLTTNAQIYINEHHTIAIEQKAYQALIASLTK